MTSPFIVSPILSFFYIFLNIKSSLYSFIIIFKTYHLHIELGLANAAYPAEELLALPGHAGEGELLVNAFLAADARAEVALVLLVLRGQHLFATEAVLAAEGDEFLGFFGEIIGREGDSGT
jgi:hypothetical protein